jgi:glutathione synthase
VNIAFIIDPITKLDPTHDSTVAMMEAAQHRGHTLWITTMDSLTVKTGEPWAQLTPVTLDPVQLVDGHWQAPEPWYRLGQPVFQSLTTMDVVMMRQDPPVTIPYLYVTQILDLLDPSQTLVINRPRGVQAANEKLYALNFPDAIPTTIVTAAKSVILDFLAEQGAVVLKPLAGKGGEGILFLKEGDRNTNSLIELSTQWGTMPVMLQQYLPAATEGDKRIILLDGEAIGAVNRIPTGTDFRGNMAVGGRVAAIDITPREQEICAMVAPRLKADGLYFVGLDVIGGYLTEVNVTSPTGIREIDRLNGVSLGDQVIAGLEQKRS